MKMQVLTQAEVAKIRNKLADLASNPLTWDRVYSELARIPAFLEFPLGEVAKPENGLLMLAWDVSSQKPQPITDGDRFNAQSLEGKYSIQRPLTSAILALGIFPAHRAQIRANKAQLREAGLL